MASHPTGGLRGFVQGSGVTEDAVPPPDPADRESAYELLQRGQQLLKRRHHAQAAVVLERAARLEPAKASIVEALGRAYFNSGQHDRAREAFETLLELDPSSHYAHFALGQSLKKLGREREAWVHLRLAVALSPGTALYRQALARVPDPKSADRASGDAEDGGDEESGADPESAAG
jgi:tetratricopeptide (TPR) repeat protein